MTDPVSTQRRERAGYGLLLLAVLGLTLSMFGGNLLFGPLNQDEGWYLYAARQQAQGLRPFRDFFYTQGPLMPRIYGWAYPLWGPLGVAGGRALTALFGLLSIGLTGWLATRLSDRATRRHAGLSAGLLLGGNAVYSYFTTIPKTYALSACFLLLGALALTAVRGRDRRSRVAAAGCAIGLACAAGVRLSLGATLAVVGLWLLWHRRRFGWAWLGFGLAGIATLAVLYAPIIYAAWPVFQFSLGFHAAREGGRGWHALMLASGSVSRTLQAYFLLWVLAIAVGLRKLLFPALADIGVRSLPAGPPADNRSASDRNLNSGSTLPERASSCWFPLGLSFAVVVGVHLLSPHPYDDYQTPVMPLAAALVAVGLWCGQPVGTGFPGGSGRLWGLAALWLCVAAGAFSAPLIQDWFVIGQDRFWLRLKREPDLIRLQRAGRWIRDRSADGDQLLTQDAYLAVETQRDLPPGLEMGPFSYFPELDDARAAALHVVNRRRLRAIVRKGGAPVAAISGYGFALQAPAMTPVPEAEREDWLALLAESYELVERMPDFGQHHTELTLWVRHEPSAGAAATF